ncbi:MAG: SOS response-associated peptidase [Terriglobales bacterium]
MCGRFTLTKSPDAISRQFELPPDALPGAAPRYNIAPSQPLYVVRAAGDGSPAREIIRALWGLIPGWTRDLATAPRPINARAETITARPAFRESFKTRRCLIPADGFYEWQAVGKRKQPWFIHRGDDELFAFGGLWDRWHDPATARWIESCTIITTAPNQLLAPVHNRMPLILAPRDYDAWLAPAHPSPTELLRPFPAEELRMYAVSPLVGNAANDRPECREPLSEPLSG